MTHLSTPIVFHISTRFTPTLAEKPATMGSLCPSPFNKIPLSVITSLLIAQIFSFRCLIPNATVLGIMLPPLCL